jgi:hypothetical protein
MSQKVQEEIDDDSADTDLSSITGIYPPRLRIFAGMDVDKAWR